MFTNNRYLTASVQAKIPFELRLFIWNCIDAMPTPKDYFQVFRLHEVGILQSIKHTSEQPNYDMTNKRERERSQQRKHLQQHKKDTLEYSNTLIEKRKRLYLPLQIFFSSLYSETDKPSERLVNAPRAYCLEYKCH